MKEIHSFILIRGIEGYETRKDYTFTEFDSVKEAVKTLGESAVLHMINNVQFDKARMEIRRNLIARKV